MKNYADQGLARGGPGVPVNPPPPLGRPSFEQTTYNIQVAKAPWQYLGRKSHRWKAHFFKICFFVKYFHHWLLSLVNMDLRAMIIRLSPLIHQGGLRYKPYYSRRSPDGVPVCPNNGKRQLVMKNWLGDWSQADRAKGVEWIIILSILPTLNKEIFMSCFERDGVLVGKFELRNKCWLFLIINL